MKKTLAFLMGTLALMVSMDAGGAIITKFQTRSHWQNNNMGFWDEVYNANYETASIWTTCPLLTILQDPYAGTIFYDDFQKFDIGTHWTSTETEGGAGDAALDIADGVGGYLTILNDALDDDSVELQWHKATESGEAWALTAGKPLWFEAKLAIDDATQSDFLIGLCVTDTAAIDAVSDGVFFQKDDGDANIDYNSTGTGGAAAVDTDSGVDAANGIFVRYGIVWDGTSTVTFFLDGVVVGTDATDVPTTELTLTIAVQNGEAVAKTLTVDYVKIVQMR
jgi:hypothetical protein